jgi:rRNA maturation protein Nop10
MTKLKKCSECKEYTLKEKCSKCDAVAEDAHYRFIKIRDAPKDSDKYWDKKRNKKG